MDLNQGTKPMKISPEARDAAMRFDHSRRGTSTFDAVDVAELTTAMQSLINSTLERAAGVAYVTCAETRHVTLGDKAATAIRKLMDGDHE